MQFEITKAGIISSIYLQSFVVFSSKNLTTYEPTCYLQGEALGSSTKGLLESIWAVRDMLRLGWADLEESKENEMLIFRQKHVSHSMLIFSLEDLVLKGGANMFCYLMMEYDYAQFFDSNI